MFGTEGTIAIRMQGNAYQALLGVESLVSAGVSTSVSVGHYLNCELWRLTAVLDDLKATDPTEELATFAERFRLSFGKLQHISGACCQRLGMRVRHAFRRMGGILYCLFRRRGRTWPEKARLAVREADVRFRAAVLDRLADSLRGLFAWLRDLCGRAEVLDELPAGPVILGMSAAQFVVKADTAEGVLVMRFQDGHQELFNLTPAQWALVMPLLVIAHAGDKLSLLLVKCIKAIEAARAWYVGACDARPDEMLSDALNPHDNHACSRFDRFVESAKRYPIGRFPVERIANCVRVARFFCQEAESVMHDIAVVNLRDAVNELVEFLSDKTTVGWDADKYERTLDKLAEKVKASLVGLRDAFYAFEHAKANPPPLPREGAKALDEIGRAVRRLDARDRRAKQDERRRHSAETQDRVQGVWEKAQANGVLREGAATRVTKRQAFDYYRDDLRALGVGTFEDFAACLGARSDRLCRARAARLRG